MVAQLLRFVKNDLLYNTKHDYTLILAHPLDTKLT